MIETCKANKIDAYKYLIYLFEHLPTLPLIHDPKLIDGYLPWSADIQNNCK
ncbi:transposase domain-containing protein [Pectinatus frisingensis]|uniref:transposase domain-containing protein n=1 Tax=Pectinatus frisingensis TaxID=865 RepID=UPI0018C83309